MASASHNQATSNSNLSDTLKDLRGELLIRKVLGNEEQYKILIKECLEKLSSVLLQIPLNIEGLTDLKSAYNQLARDVGVRELRLKATVR